MKLFNSLPAALIGAAIVFVQPQIASALMAEDVQSIAEEITVLIPQKWMDSKGNQKETNGSGFIIAKQGNTYTVLTAYHVTCRTQNREACLNFYDMRVVTDDGKEHKVENSTVKKLPDVDLAVLQFTSDKNYQVAKLANYDPKLRSERQVQLPNGEMVREYGQFVFASGWPGINDRDITKLNYRFSVGRLMPPDRIVGFKIRQVSDNEDQGYEAVYTSITFQGMSGPVLDTDGRVIAIHGQNDGEIVYDESSQDQKNRRVQMGYSLSIPIDKFLNLAPLVGIQLSLNLKQIPTELTADELDSIGTQYVISGLENQNLPQDNSAIYWANQGNQYWRALKPDLALKAYDAALKIDPNFYPIWYGKGLVQTFEGYYAEALKSYNKALQIIDQKIVQDSKNPDIKRVQGWVQSLRDKVQLLVANSQPSQPAPQPSLNNEENAGSTIAPQPGFNNEQGTDSTIFPQTGEGQDARPTNAPQPLF